MRGNDSRDESEMLNTVVPSDALDVALYDALNDARRDDSAGLGDTCRKVCIYDIQNSVYNGNMSWILWINNNNDRFKSKG